MPYLTCPECKRDFYTKPSHVDRRKTCSKKCLSSLKRKQMSGENNHQYGLRGPANSSFKGGRRISNYGYVLIYDPERGRGSDDYVLEHRAVMEKKLGRKLRPDEIVHHKDEDKQNNDPDNLELTTRPLHSKHHYSDIPRPRDKATGRLISYKK